MLGCTGGCLAAVLMKGSCKPQGRLGTASCSSKKIFEEKLILSVSSWKFLEML